MVASVRYRVVLLMALMTLGTAAAGQARVVVEASAEPLTAYVGQQIILQVRALRPLGSSQGQLSEPQVDGAEISLLGNIDIYNETRGEHDFQVVHKRYAVVPRRSGELSIRGIEFARAAVDATQYTDDPGLPDEAAMIVPAAAAVIRISVVEHIGDARRWLPAHSLKIEDRWSRTPGALSAGDALTRTVTIVATGIAATDLPVLSMPEVNAYIVHTDQPELATEYTPHGMQARRTERFVLLVAESVDVPAIEVPWFNPIAKSQHVARIDSVSLRTSGAARPNPASTALSRSDENERSWIWPASALCLALLLAIALWYSRTRHLRVLLRALKRACGSNDARLAAHTLLAIGNLCWPANPPASLPELAERLGGDARLLVDELDRCLYSTGQPWDGLTRFTTLRAALRRRRAPPTNNRHALLRLHGKAVRPGTI